MYNKCTIFNFDNYSCILRFLHGLRCQLTIGDRAITKLREGLVVSRHKVALEQYISAFLLGSVSAAYNPRRVSGFTSVQARYLSVLWGVSGKILVLIINYLFANV